MTEMLGERPAVCLLCRRIVLVLALFFACQTRLLAASGLSDWLATRACWLQPPYAVSKCYSRSGGPYNADLFLGRPSQDGDMWDYDGIVHVQSVASNLSRVAVTPRHLIVEYAGLNPSFGIIDSQRGSVKPVDLKSWDQLRQYLKQQGENGEGIHFQTFEEIYRERVPWWWNHTTELGGLIFLLLVALGLVMIWRVRRKRRFNRSVKQAIRL